VLRHHGSGPASPGALIDAVLYCYDMRASQSMGIAEFLGFRGEQFLRSWALRPSLTTLQDREREQILNLFQNLDYSTPSVQFKTFFLKKYIYILCLSQIISHFKNFRKSKV